ncbi:hypothetical protein PG993_014475 [Apiospora rasikravindrae]|uniref:Prolyl 4-hydroxylase alpha subunit domain-containing protein n=1 Tax=Apiospora rasikravindrae TaxID=990691 RepID=A0ABR1RMU0_9PEZI
MAKTKGPKSNKRELEQPAKTPSPAAPKWPAFKPALPVTSLSLEEAHPTYRDKILLVRNFFPKSLCRDYVTYLRGLPFTTTPGRPKRGEAVRVNDRYQIDDLQFAQRLWRETGLKELLLDDSVSSTWNGEVVGLNPNIRIYRYSQNQFFDAHYDDYNLVTLPSANGDSKSKAAVGGETVFYPKDRKVESEAITVSLETGMLLLHKHGDDCLLHEGREVLEGEKWVIRTDLCVKR